MDNNLGLGVMLRLLGDDGSTARNFQAAVGKTITEVKMENDNLYLNFSDHSGIVLYDDGQSCCESRYMTTDDKLEDFVGATLVGGEIREAPDVVDDYAYHEVQFLLITTSKGVFTLETHNEHNGYYGGFAIVCKVTHTGEEMGSKGV